MPGTEEVSFLDDFGPYVLTRVYAYDGRLFKVTVGDESGGDSADAYKGWLVEVYPHSEAVTTYKSEPQSDEARKGVRMSEDLQRVETEDADIDSRAVRLLGELARAGGALITCEGEPLATILPVPDWMEIPDDLVVFHLGAEAVRVTEKRSPEAPKDNDAAATVVDGKDEDLLLARINRIQQDILGLADVAQGTPHEMGLRIAAFGAADALRGTDVDLDIDTQED